MKKIPHYACKLLAFHDFISILMLVIYQMLNFLSDKLDAEYLELVEKSCVEVIPRKYYLSMLTGAMLRFYETAGATNCDVQYVKIFWPLF